MVDLNPPRVARLLLSLFLAGERREVVIGDLDEEFLRDVLPARGRIRAHLWYWHHAAASAVASRRVPRLPTRRNSGPLRLMDATMRDLRFAIRNAGRTPGFTAVAVLTLAFGVGANTAIFTLVNETLLRPLPYDDPDRLVLLWNRLDATGTGKVAIATPDVLDYRTRSQAFQDIAATDRMTDASLTGPDDVRHVRVGRATVNLFDVLGVRAAVGRTFGPEDTPILPDRDDSAPAVVVPILLSHGLWDQAFGSDAEVVGRTVELNGQPAVIVGVLPPGFYLAMPPDVGIPTDADIWAPLILRSDRGVRSSQRARDQDSDDTGAVVARLAPGTTLERARADMDGVAAWQREMLTYHRNTGLRIDVLPMHADVTSHARPVLIALSGAVGFVLLIACINVANLLLTRAMGRRREMAIRSALGATRLQIGRQLLIESLLLATAGGSLGWLLSWGTLAWLSTLMPSQFGTPGALDGNTRVFLFTAVVTLLSAVLFGLAPLLDAGSGKGAGLLRRRDASVGRDRQALRQILVVMEVALSLAVLVAAGLLLKTVAALQRVEPGFDPRGVLTFDLSLRDPERYRGPADRSRFIAELEQRVSALPGVESIGLVGRLPLAGRSWTNRYGLPGESEAEWSGNEANFRMVTPGYFGAIGTRILLGRSFTEREANTEARRVVIIDEKMAARLAARGNPLGQRIGFPLDGRSVNAEVVGVVEHVRHESLVRESRETLYVPYRHEASRDVSIVVRTSGDPSHLAGPIRRAAMSLDAGLPIYNVRALQTYVDDALAPFAFALRALGAFAILAMVLAGVGLYGVLSFIVRQRTRDIGVRMALGARRREVVLAFVRQGMGLTAMGIGLGIVISWAGSGLLRSMLFGVDPQDPSTLATAASLVALVSLAACYVPARRASRVDPITALRGE